MRIAVCDDERITLNEIKELLKDYREISGAAFEFELFEHYSSLADRLGEFDVFLLDYKMPDIDGLEFAKELHEKYDEKKTIVFITAYPEIVYDSFEVRTFRFMVKPVKKEDFFKMMNSVLKRYASQKRITVKSTGETVSLDVDEIYYITVNSKDVYIHLKDRCFLCHRTVDSFEEELTFCGFFRTHREFLVNTKKIKSFDCKNVVMKNGDKVLMSPRRYPKFQEVFFED